MKKRIGLIAACAAGLIATTTPYTPADASGGLGIGIKHVLLISVDGMHAVDFQNCRVSGVLLPEPCAAWPPGSIT